MKKPRENGKNALHAWGGRLVALVLMLLISLPAYAVNVYYETFGGAYRTNMRFHEGFANHYGKIYDTGGKLVKQLPDNIRGSYFSDGRMLFEIDDRFGYFDKNFNVAIQPIYSEAGPFSEGLAAVRLPGGDFGYINAGGDTVIAPIYSQADDFHEGLAGVHEREGAWRTGFIDKSGNMVITGDFSLDGYFSEGLAKVVGDDVTGHNSGASGFVDTSGRFAVPPMYTDAKPFSEGLAAVRTAEGKWGYIDKSGNMVIPAVYHDAKIFSDGLAAVALEQGYNTEYGFIDKTGKMVIPILYMGHESDELQFHEGLCSVAYNNDPNQYRGYIDKNNKMVIKRQYNFALDFKEGYALAHKGGEAVVLKNPLGYTPPVQPAQPAVPAAPDPNPSDWAKADIAAAIAAGIVPQKLQNNYRQNITRAEFCSLGAALIELRTGSAIPITASFSDTTDPDVLKLASLGIVSGVGEGKFSPSGSITREQAAKMLAGVMLALGLAQITEPVTFADSAKISPWATEYIGVVTAYGVMNGVGNNNFDPQGTYTREQAMITMLRASRAQS